MIVAGQRSTMVLSDNWDGEFISAENTQALAEKLAVDVAAWLNEGIQAQGSASLVVSGGSTPAPFFKALSLHDIDWSKVTVTLADERWVPMEDSLSNESVRCCNSRYGSVWAVMGTRPHYFLKPKALMMLVTLRQINSAGQ